MNTFLTDLILVFQSETTGGFASVWNSANDRLRQYGLNSFSVAGYRVDPLHLVVAILGFVLSGPMMLAIVVAAIVISQSSGDSTSPSVRQTGGEASSSQYHAQGDARQPNRNKGPFSGSGQSNATFGKLSKFQVISRRESSTIPSVIAPLFQYASECYFTQGLQSSMEALHGVGLSWPVVFVASGVALRIASSPLHIFAEKLFARRLHAQNFFTEGILKKLGEHYKVEVVPNPAKSKLELKTKDAKIISHCEKLVSQHFPFFFENSAD
ncbi:hypothetical protein COOONC_00268, partial [Cooperia oncophora]